MGNGFQFLDIILYGAIAAFFVYRLRGVLGKRTGHDKPSFGGFPTAKRKKDESGEEKVVHLPDRSGPDRAEEAEPGFEEVSAEEAAPDLSAAENPLAAGLGRIALADKSFSESGFVTGARGAFEMIVGAFAGGDAKILRPLLSNDVYRDFAGAIEARKRKGTRLETTLVGIKSVDIIEAELDSRTAFVTVKFVSEQINVLHDRDDEVLEGDASHVAKITDIWTFARNTRSRDPNWTLVATRSPN
jgi:predicted lipid-binding transport protein (Tim44 family)